MSYAEIRANGGAAAAVAVHDPDVVTASRPCSEACRIGAATGVAIVNYLAAAVAKLGVATRPRRFAPPTTTAGSDAPDCRSVAQQTNPRQIRKVEMC